MPDFPKLIILPTESLIIHEKHDDQRTAPLILGIKSSKILRNPPIVTPLEDASNRYLVLDGANRTTAIKKMRIPHIVVQVIDPDDSKLNLHTWNHVVWEHNPIRFLKGIRGISEIVFHQQIEMISPPDINHASHLAIIKNCKGRTYLIQSTSKDLKKKVEILNQLVDSYKERGRLDRTYLEDVKFLEDTYPSFCGLVIFPRFSMHDLLTLAGRGFLLPTGITRFTISPRALHLNYPLSELTADKSIEEKNENLRATIQDKINRKSVRYYAEPTYLFDDSSE